MPGLHAVSILIWHSLRPSLGEHAPWDWDRDPLYGLDVSEQWRWDDKDIPLTFEHDGQDPSLREYGGREPPVHESDGREPPLRGHGGRLPRVPRGRGGGASLLQERGRLGAGHAAEAALHGIRAITTGIRSFTRDPPEIEEGLQLLDEGLWEVVELPGGHDARGPEEARGARRLWDQAFRQIPAVVDDLRKFQREGDAGALVSALTSVLDTVWDSCSDRFPSIARRLGAIKDLVDGLGAGWDLFAAGETVPAVEAVWGAVQLAARTIAPAASESSGAFKAVLGALDGVVGELNSHVLDYKRHVLGSGVCWKRSTRRARVRPDQCREGFAWDGRHTCLPTAGYGANCWRSCGGAGGMCEPFCGHGGACCRPGFASDPAECRGASGYRDFAFTKGSAYEYHQCVRPGPALEFETRGCNETRLNGWWVRDGEHSGRPRYARARDPRVVMEWSQSRGVWRLYVDKKSFGLKTLLGLERLFGGRTTLYESAEDGAFVPALGWETVHGGGGAPTIHRYSPDAAGAREVSGALDVSLMAKGAPGTMGATCNATSAYKEENARWCLAACPAGYVERGQMCEQSCGGEFSEDGPKMCGTNYGKILVAMAEITLAAIRGAIKTHDLLQQLKDNSIQIETLSGTISTFIEMGKPVARLFCRADALNQSSLLN